MLGDNIKTLREARGLSQEELSGRLNVVRQTVSKWERGLSVPDSQMLIKLAEVLGVTPDVLLGTGGAAGNEDEDTIAGLLADINAQLARRNKHLAVIQKALLIPVCIVLAVWLSIMVLSAASCTAFSYVTDEHVSQTEVNTEYEPGE